MENMPRAYVPVIRAEGYGLGIAVKGEGGYYATDWPTVDTWAAACRWADEANTRLGLTSDDAYAIVCDTIARQHGEGIRGDGR